MTMVENLIDNVYFGLAVVLLIFTTPFIILLLIYDKAMKKWTEVAK
jgi:hypothetical protein